MKFSRLGRIEYSIRDLPVFAKWNCRGTEPSLRRRTCIMKASVNQKHGGRREDKVSGSSYIRYDNPQKSSLPCNSTGNSFVVRRSYVVVETPWFTFHEATTCCNHFRLVVPIWTSCYRAEPRFNPDGQSFRRMERSKTERNSHAKSIDDIIRGILRSGDVMLPPFARMTMIAVLFAWKTFVSEGKKNVFV
mgnify:CR=1 FL=1